MCVRLIGAPVDLDAELFTEAVVVKHAAVLRAELMDHLGDLHVVAAVLGDLHQLALLEPLQSLQAVGGFLRAERGGGDRVELEAVREDSLQIHHQVE